MFTKRRMGSWMGALCLAAGAFGQTYTTIDPAPLGITYRVFPLSINNKGAIAGYYVFNDGGGPQFGFVRDASGAITSFPTPFTQNPTNTFANSINDAGAITGRYQFLQISNGMVILGNPQGYVRDPQGNLTTFDPPGSISRRLKASMQEARSPAITMKRIW